MPELHQQFSLDTDIAQWFGQTLRRSCLESEFNLRGSYLQFLCLGLAAGAHDAEHIRLLVPRDGYAWIHCVHAAVQHLQLHSFRGHVLEVIVGHTGLHLRLCLRLHATLSLTVFGIIRTGRLAGGLMHTL